MSTGYAPAHRLDLAAVRASVAADLKTDKRKFSHADFAARTLAEFDAVSLTLGIAEKTNQNFRAAAKAAAIPLPAAATAAHVADQVLVRQIKAQENFAGTVHGRKFYPAQVAMVLGLEVQRMNGEITRMEEENASIEAVAKTNRENRAFCELAHAKAQPPIPPEQKFFNAVERNAASGMTQAQAVAAAVEKFPAEYMAWRRTGTPSLQAITFPRKP